jgi:predicted nucleotidyltransferase
MEEKSKLDFTQELDAARTIRDELRLKAHLAKADIKDELQRLEARFHQIEEDVQRTRDHLKEPAEAIGQKSVAIVRELRTAMETIRRRLSEPTN